MDTLVEYFHKNFYPDLNMEDVAKAIHSDPVRKEKAVSFIKSKHYSDVDEEVFNKAASSMFNTPVSARDNTYTQAPYVFPVFGNMPKTAVNSANIGPDTRNKTQRDMAESYSESVFRPGVTFSEIPQMPLRYMSNPLKALGDMGVFGMPNTTEDRIQRRIVQESPYMTYEEKRSASLDEARDLGINAGINVGTAELGFAIPRSVLTPRLLNVFSQGSKANLTSDLLQLTKTDFDKIKQGDAEEIFNTAINAAGVKSKLGNFDASTVYSNIKNWSNISTDDKIDTFKDLFNLGNAAVSQTQRIK